jgi:hypothetical protein
MAIRLQRAKLDEFSAMLFRLLDRLGLLPQDRVSTRGTFYPWHRAKPNEFEKYPRLLLGSIERYQDVEAGFTEWESRVLRDAPYRKMEHYPELEGLRQWLVQHSDDLTNKANSRHLRTSLYARVFQYLYPRRILANGYTVKCQQSEQMDALEPEVLSKLFPMSIETEVHKLRSAYTSEWESIVADAREDLLVNAKSYGRRLKGKLPEEPAGAPEANSQSIGDQEVSDD